MLNLSENELVFFRESQRSSRAQHNCPASRFHKKVLPATTLWFQQVSVNYLLPPMISFCVFYAELKLLLCGFVHCVSCVVSVCVYMNKHGNCGPHLDRKQMQHLPDHFGPGPVNAVLQQVVQSCIDCAYQPKVLLSALQTHSGGGEVVQGSKTYTVQVLGSYCIDDSVSQDKEQYCFKHSEFLL